MNDHVRVRFAPSPTGMPHLGNARAALVNFIFAKQNNGQFLVRIEDTDAERSTIEFKNALFDMLSWLNISYDETPIIQSSRLLFYREKASYLYNNGYAYYCNCIKDSAENNICKCKNLNHTSGVLRFNVPKNQIIEYNDLVYGHLSVNTNDIEDFALLRSDGNPTYHLCVVIDDIESKITHIIRGEDHRTNTFKQILLYNVFKSNIPIFGHMPMILGTDGKKLSKRNGGSSVEYFRELGIDYRAMINSMMRLGWGYNGQDRLTEDEFQQHFNINNMLRKSAKLDIDKMYKDSQVFIKDDCMNNLAQSSQRFQEFTSRYFNVSYNTAELYPRLYANAVEKSKTYLDIYKHVLFLYEKQDCELNEIEVSNIKQYITNNIHLFKQELTLETSDIIIKNLVALKLHKTFRLIIMHSNIGCDLTESLYALGLEGLKRKLPFNIEDI